MNPLLSMSSSVSSKEEIVKWAAAGGFRVEKHDHDYVSKEELQAMRDCFAAQEKADAMLKAENQSDDQYRVYRRPMLPSTGLREIIHPALRIGMIRGRGDYWWTQSQIILEDMVEKGEITLVKGEFYVFLEEVHRKGCNVMGHPIPPETDQTVAMNQGMILRYGNVFMGDFWIKRAVAFPMEQDVEHEAPYKMIDVIEKWRKEPYSGSFSVANQ